MNFDGACEPVNPGGNMGFGTLIVDLGSGETIYEGSGFSPASPLNSNNVAEYLALIQGFEWLIENGLQNSKIKVLGDSQLVIKQMSGEWPAKKGLYVPHYQRAIKLRIKFPNITFNWIPRNENAGADKLSKAHVQA